MISHYAFRSLIFAFDLVVDKSGIYAGEVRRWRGESYLTNVEVPGLVVAL